MDSAISFLLSRSSVPLDKEYNDGF
jgi:hypothetical protein